MHKLISGRCYVRVDGTALPISHPDGWTLIRRFRNEESIANSIFVGREIVGGCVVLLFSHGSKVFAQPLSARSWDDVEDAPCNRDLTQEALHKTLKTGEHDEK